MDLSRSFTTSTPSKRSAIKYKYVTLAQAFSKRDSSSALNVFGVIVELNSISNLVVLKDESGCRFELKLEKQANDLQFHLGDILRAHRMRYIQLRESDGFIFYAKCLDLVVFQAFISSENKTALLSHLSKEPTITEADHERAYDLDRWHSQQIAANCFCNLNINDRTTFTNLAGQLLAVQCVSATTQVLCVWDCTSLPKLCRNVFRPVERFSEFRKHANYDLVSDRQKAFITVYDKHAENASRLELGCYVFVSNVSITRQLDGELLSIDLHSNLTRGKWIRSIRSDSIAGRMLADRIAASDITLVNEFFSTANIDLSVPMIESSSQSQPETELSQPNDNQSKPSSATQGNSQSSDFGLRSLSVESQAAIDQISKRIPLPDIDEEDPIASTSRGCSNHVPTENSNKSRKRTRTEYESEQVPPLNSASPSTIVRPATTKATNEPQTPVRSQFSEQPAKSCKFASSEYSCFICKTSAHEYSMDRDQCSQISTQESSELYRSDAIIHSVDRYLRKARSNRPGSVVGWISDFFPGKECCLNMFELIFLSCSACKLLVSFNSLLNYLTGPFSQICNDFALANGMNSIQLKIPCSKCQSWDTKIHFHVPLVIRDHHGSSLIALLTGEAANNFFKTRPLEALVSTENQATICEFFEDLLFPTHDKSLYKIKHFSLARFGNIYEIMSIGEVSHETLQEFSQLIPKVPAAELTFDSDESVV
jgi:hypothetical protein